jgi:hypothetical protein
LTKSISYSARKKASKLAVLFILIGTTFLFYPQANAAYANTNVICAKQDGTQQTFQIGWDNSNQFFADRGYIPRLYCEGGYAPSGFNVYVSDNLSDSALGYYNGVVPTPVVIGPESPSETQTVNSETATVPSESETAPSSESATASESETPTSDTQTSTTETTSATVDTPTSTVESPTPVLPAETSTVDTQTAESIPTPVVTPLPDPVPVVQPEPVVVPPPAPRPEPLPEPIPDPIPEPEPEPTVDNIDEPGLQMPEVNEPVVEEPVVAEPVTETPTEPEVVAEPEPLEPEVIPTEPEPTPEPIQPETPIFTPEPIVPEVVQLTASTDLSVLPPDTPVELENGVVLTAEVVIALTLLENPAELLAELFTDPGQVLMALGNIGADMSPEVREQSEKVIIAAVIAGNIATQAAASAALAAYRRNI